MSELLMNATIYQRRGSTLTELIVAGGLLVTAFGLVGTCVVGGQRVQRMQREHTLAVDELSNQLERLTSLPPSEIDDRLQHLEPSAWLAERLPEARWTALRSSDELGDRIELQLQWKRLGQPPPLSAVAWLAASDMNASPQSATFEPEP